MNNRMIRVFLSSTFRDFQVERSQLNRYVFSELEVYCRSQGVSFQIIDLRWGIPEQSAHNNETMQICLDEIERCQKLSPDMNFLILSGMRYGWRPLPGAISNADWQQMSGRMTDCEKNWLSQWYLLDENDLQKPYVLRKRTEDDEADWEETEKTIQNILFPLAEQCLEEGKRIFYGPSATEQEVYKGFLAAVNEKSLENTLILLKDSDVLENGESVGSGGVMEPGVAELRNKIINRVGSENAEDQILHYCLEDAGNAGYTVWVKKTYDFLRERIDQQIAGILAKEAEEEEKEQFLEGISFAEAMYQHRPELERCFDEFLIRNREGVLLLEGDSGTGKSTWLKHWYYNHRGMVVASFSDSLHYGKSVLYAIRFCVAQLVELGLLKAPNTSPDYENLVTWLDETLTRIRTSAPVTIILDSVDDMQDWDKITGSLFGMRLKKNVRVLISCVSEKSLTENDRRENPTAFCWKLLDRGEGLDWLDAYLKKAGRCLCDAQRTQIFASMPEHCTALYVYFLSVLCSSLRSFEPIDFMLPDSTETMVKLLFQRQSENYYPVLYRHTAGYLALSSEGLSEQEILELLSMDTEVIDEIKTQTEWRWDESFHIPMALWSRLYCMFMPLLTESYSGGVLTMRFRHSMLKKVCLTETNSARMTETEKTELLRPGEAGELRVRMKNYFESEKQTWRFSSGNVNVRKLQELYPILLQLEDWDGIGQLFGEPDYPEAMLLTGGYHELVNQMLLYREKCGVTDRQERLLALLLERPLLFQTWPSGFFSNAVGRGVWMPEERGETRVFYYLDDREIELDEKNGMFYIPNIHLYQLALRSDRILAVYICGKKDARIRLYDLKTGRDLGISAFFRENTSVSDGVQLFWRGSCLIVRTRLSRHYFRYNMDTGAFYEERRVSLKGWGQIYKRKEKPQDEEAIWEVNVFHRKSGNEEEGYWCVSCYQENGFSEYMLPYDDQDELFVSCFYLQAAVFENGTVRLFDLKMGVETGYFQCKECSNFFWSNSGKELLIVRDDDYLNILAVGEEEKEYKPQSILPVDTRKNDARAVYNRWSGFTGSALSEPIDAGAGVLTGNQYTDMQPVCVAISVSKDWCAAYYREQWQSIVMISRLSTGKRLAYFRTDPIYWCEACEPVFYAPDQGEKLVLVSQGRRHVLDMNLFFQEMSRSENSDLSLWKTEEVRNTDAEAAMLPDAVRYCLRDTYTEKMKKWIPVKKKKSLLTRYIELLWGNQYSSTSDIEQWELERLGSLPVYVQNNRYWLVDAPHSMVHVCDDSGNWLCHYQAREPFVAADVTGDTLHLLSKDTFSLQSYKFNICGMESGDDCVRKRDGKLSADGSTLKNGDVSGKETTISKRTDAGGSYENTVLNRNRRDMRNIGNFVSLAVKAITILAILLLAFVINSVF